MGRRGATTLAAREIMRIAPRRAVAVRSYAIWTVQMAWGLNGRRPAGISPAAVWAGARRRSRRAAFGAERGGGLGVRAGRAATVRVGAAAVRAVAVDQIISRGDARAGKKKRRRRRPTARRRTARVAVGGVDGRRTSTSLRFPNPRAQPSLLPRASCAAATAWSLGEWSPSSPALDGDLSCANLLPPFPVLRNARCRLRDVTPPPPRSPMLSKICLLLVAASSPFREPHDSASSLGTPHGDDGQPAAVADGSHRDDALPGAVLCSHQPLTFLGLHRTGTWGNHS
nr:uncharacterized protein LOC127325732 [Lolium perenne]